MSPKFSIIIPVYNVAPYLRECLDSVLAQTFADWEAICVDDGSTDGSGLILDDYAEMDRRFRVIHRQNAGVSVARNVALEVTDGDWFLFLDGDDMFRPDALEHFFEIIGETKCDAILMQPYVEYFSREEVVRTKPFCVIQRMSNGVDLMTGEISANGFPFGRVYKTRLFGHLRFEDGIGMSEDVLFWSEAIGVQSKWVLVRGSYYYYRQRADSVSRRYDYDHYGQIVDVNLRVARRLLKYDDSGDAVKKYWQRYRWSCEQVKDAFGRWSEYNSAQRRKLLSYETEINMICSGIPYSTEFRFSFLLHRLNFHCIYLMTKFVVRVLRWGKRRAKIFLKGGGK